LGVVGLRQGWHEEWGGKSGGRNRGGLRRGDKTKSCRRGLGAVTRLKQTQADTGSKNLSVAYVVSGQRRAAW
jgi:hypothetical protein